MEQELFWQEQKKKMLKGMALILGVIALFYAAVCTPVYRFMTSDVLYQGTVLALLWDILMTLTYYLFYWVAASCLLYSGACYGFSRIKPLIAVYGGIVFARYFANHLASCVIDGGQSINDFFTDYFPYILLDILLDMVLMAVAVGMTLFCLRRKLPRGSDRALRSAFLSSSLPATRLFDKDNTFMSCMLGVAAIPALSQLISRLIYDIFVGRVSGGDEVLLMVVYYLSDILFWIAGYLVIQLLMNRFYLSDIKAKSEWKE